MDLEEASDKEKSILALLMKHWACAFEGTFI